MKERKFSPRSLASKNYLVIFKREFSSLEVVIVGNNLKFLNESIIRNLFKNMKIKKRPNIFNNILICLIDYFIHHFTYSSGYSEYIFRYC